MFKHLVCLNVFMLLTCFSWQLLESHSAKFRRNQINKPPFKLRSSDTLPVDPGGAGGKEASIDCKSFFHFVYLLQC